MRGCRRGSKSRFGRPRARPAQAHGEATGSGHGWPYGPKGNTFQKWVTETSPLSAAKRYVTSSLSCPDHSIAKGRTAHGSPSGSKHEGTAHGPVQALEAREPGRARPRTVQGSPAHGLTAAEGHELDRPEAREPISAPVQGRAHLQVPRTGQVTQHLWGVYGARYVRGSAVQGSRGSTTTQPPLTAPRCG